jgi:hypothetical protein
MLMPPDQTDNKSDENQYDFITKDAPKVRKPSLLGSQTSFMQRLIVILGGGIIIIIVIIIIASIFSSKPKTADLLSIAKTQSTLLSLANLGESTASQQVTKDLAANVELTITSGQVSLVKYLNAVGGKITPLSLHSIESTTLSTELTSTHANNFDFEYIQLTQAQLTDYVSALKQVFSASDPHNQKIILSNLYVTATILLKQANAAATSLVGP